MNVKISNHPVINTIERYAECTNLNYEPLASKFSLTLKITHFLGGQLIGELTKSVTCVADNVQQVPLPDGTSIGDYDAFSVRLEAGDSMLAMLTDGINLVDAVGTINTKMNYQS